MKITTLVEDNHQQPIRIEPRESEKPGAFRCLTCKRVAGSATMLPAIVVVSIVR